MIGRALTVFALIAALVFGATAQTVCAPREKAVTCASCCEEGKPACCDIGAQNGKSVPLAPDRVMPANADLLAAPLLVEIAVIAAGDHFNAHPVLADISFTHSPPLIARTCIRLI